MRRMKGHAGSLGRTPRQRHAWAGCSSSMEQSGSATPRGRFRLPPVYTSFQGREREAAKILTRLKSGVRVLTLHGPGGVGKTRLAIEVMHRVADRYDRRVLFVPLDVVTEPGMGLGVVASRLGSPEE